MIDRMLSPLPILPCGCKHYGTEMRAAADVHT